MGPKLQSFLKVKYYLSYGLIFQHSILMLNILGLVQYIYSNMSL